MNIMMHDTQNENHFPFDTYVFPFIVNLHNISVHSSA